MTRLGLDDPLILLVDMSQLLECLPPDVLDELTGRRHQFFGDLDRLRSRDELGDIDFRVYKLLTVECFAERRLKHVARVGRDLVLQELGRELSPPVEVGLPKVPDKAGQVKQALDIPQRNLVALLNLRVRHLLQLDESRVVEVHAVVNLRLGVEEHHEVIGAVSDLL